jgi:hypothetical protein
MTASERSIPAAARPARLRRASLAALLALAGAVPFVAARATPLQVKDPWVRETPNPRSTAAYMVFVNTGDSDLAVVSVTSPSARVVELHEMAMEGTTMRMRRVERIRVPKQSEVALKPGGLHVMLIDLGRPLRPGEQVQLTFGLEDGRTVDVSAPVRALGSR